MYSDEFPRRSIKQHNTEWLYYQIISDSTGSTPYEVYEIMAMRFLKVIDVDGDMAYMQPKFLNTKHHNMYLEQIKMFMAGYNIVLPDPSHDPDEQYKSKKQIR